jgi:hypothetical protein
MLRCEPMTQSADHSVVAPAASNQTIVRELWPGREITLMRAPTVSIGAADSCTGFLYNTESCLHFR